MDQERDLKEFCVICLSTFLAASVYAQYIMKSPIPDFALRDGWRIESRGNELVNVTSAVAGRPGNMIEIARHVGYDNTHMIYINGSPAGLWAQLEWFGLRICAQDMWRAQELWERGGNKNWRP